MSGDFPAALVKRQQGLYERWKASKEPLLYASKPFAPNRVCHSQSKRDGCGHGLMPLPLPVLSGQAVVRVFESFGCAYRKAAGQPHDHDEHRGDQLPRCSGVLQSPRSGAWHELRSLNRDAKFQPVGDEVRGDDFRIGSSQNKNLKRTACWITFVMD